ncbi:hypothetical protein F5X96DRAFT_674041 [Biscogniauxia mediterranea]|nr:hypothetical protein F5X96DRAFT_674041 [Biscogniauxia mediterranea]
MRDLARIPSRMPPRPGLTLLLTSILEHDFCMAVEVEPPGYLWIVEPGTYAVGTETIYVSPKTPNDEEPPGVGSENPAFVLGISGEAEAGMKLVNLVCFRGKSIEIRTRGLRMGTEWNVLQALSMRSDESGQRRSVDLQIQALRPTWRRAVAIIRRRGATGKRDEKGARGRIRVSLLSWTHGEEVGGKCPFS